ncbi:hypothetical protein AB0P12_08160, partial [Streptomyces subrutilus]|uniref:hypothetical protein n=1 Tax=Streptomyces subrutilus TaxID=36818 RepID=UPI0034145103
MNDRQRGKPQDRAVAGGPYTGGRVPVRRTRPRWTTLARGGRVVLVDPALAAHGRHLRDLVLRH